MKEIFSFQPKFFAGLTLIELLVVITIISLFAGLGLAGYNNLNQRQKLLSSGQNFKNLLRDAQSRALNIEVDCQVCDCQISATSVLKGWYVDFGQREVYGVCRTEEGFFPTIFPKKIEFAQGVEITPYLTPGVTPYALIFGEGYRGANQDATFCLSSRNLPDLYYVVRVNRAGKVSDEGGLVGVCSP